MVEEKATKIKKKKWIQVASPALFRNELIGEIPVREVKSLIGRTVTVNLMSLTRDIKKQNTQVKVIINGIKGDTATTELYGYYLNPASIKRLVRRGKEKIGLTVICKTSDNKKVRMMPLIVPYSKVKGSIATAFRKKATDYLTSYISKTTFENIIKELIMNKLQREIKSVIKKIYPARIVEVAKLHIEREKKPAEVEVKEEVKEAPKKEEKAEEKPKEETPKEEIKKEETKPEVKKEEEPKEEVKKAEGKKEAPKTEEKPKEDKPKEEAPKEKPEQQPKK